MPLPAFRTINGEGRPRFIVRKPNSSWASFGTTTYFANRVVEANGAAKTITTSDTDDVVTTSTAHGLVAGDRCYITGHSGSTPDINGEQQVASYEAFDKFKIATNITVGGTGGTASKTPDFTKVQVGMRLLATVTRAGDPPDLQVYGRIKTVQRLAGTTKTIYVDEWVGGTPTDTNAYTVNGWVVNLPLCQDLTQVFDPDQLEHPVWRSRITGKWYGFKYSAVLSYEQWISADALYDLRRAINLEEDDRLVFVPHVDDAGFQYPVRYSGPLNIGLFGIGGGHKGIVFRFKGTQNVAFPLKTGYGFNYAYEYGTYL